MEWTISEQVRFVGQSICLGIMIGILLDIFSGLERNRTRIYRFWLDVLFGPLAAILLFLGSLVIMDGQMHPLLIFGAFVGLLLEHLTLGRYLSKAVVFLRKWCCKVTALFGKICSVFGAVLRKMAIVWPKGHNKSRKKMKKEENLYLFFKKDLKSYA